MKLNPGGGCGCCVECKPCGSVPNTGVLTCSVFGVASMAFTGSAYAGSLTYNYPGNEFCPPAVVPLHFIIRCGDTWELELQLPVNSEPCQLCPAATAFANPVLILGSVLPICSPLMATWSIPAGSVQGCTGVGTYYGNLVAGAAQTFTFTP